VVDALVVVLERREEAVREAVQEPVEDDDRALELAGLALVALPEVVAARRVLSADRDEVALRIEAVHFDEPVGVGRRRGAVDDQEDEVSVLLQLRPLTELLGILERQRVETEDVAQEGEVVLVRAFDVQPEEVSTRDASLDLRPVGLRLLAAVAVEKGRAHGRPEMRMPLFAL
jgi:hypothetical protein